MHWRRSIDVVQPDLKWSGGLSEVVKIYTIAEAAGIATIPHTGAGNPFGQHFALAMPRDGYVVPPDAPGFGMDIKPEWIAPWDHTAAAKARAKV